MHDHVYHDPTGYSGKITRIDFSTYPPTYDIGINIPGGNLYGVEIGGVKENDLDLINPIRPQEDQNDT